MTRCTKHKEQAINYNSKDSNLDTWKCDTLSKLSVKNKRKFMRKYDLHFKKNQFLYYCNGQEINQLN